MQPWFLADHAVLSWEKVMQKLVIVMQHCINQVVCAGAVLELSTWLGTCFTAHNASHKTGQAVSTGECSACRITQWW